MPIVDTFAPMRNALAGMLQDRDRREVMDFRRRQDMREEEDAGQRRQLNALALETAKMNMADRQGLRSAMQNRVDQGDGGPLPERVQLDHAISTGNMAEAQKIGEFITNQASEMSKLGDREGARRYFQDATGTALGAIAASKDDWIQTRNGLFNWRTGEARQGPAGPQTLDQVRGGMAQRGDFDTLQKTFPERAGRPEEDLATFEKKEQIRAKYRPTPRDPNAPKPATGAQLASVERNKSTDFQKAEGEFRKRVEEIKAGFSPPEEQQALIDQAEEDLYQRKQEIEDSYLSQREQYGLTSPRKDYREQLARKRGGAKVAGAQPPTERVDVNLDYGQGPAPARPPISRQQALEELRRRGVIQ